MKGIGSRWTHGAALALVVVGIAAWSLAPAGIIELGKKGQNKTGSLFQITVNDASPVTDANSPTSTDAAVILEGLRLKLVAQGFDAQPAAFDPNDPNRNALVILNGDGTEPAKLKVHVEDSPSGIFGGASKVNSGPGGPPIYLLDGLEEMAGDGYVYLDVSLQTGGALGISPVSTNVAGATPQDKAAEVRHQIVLALRGAGLTVTPTNPGSSGQISIRSPSNKITSFGTKTDDTMAKEVFVHRANEGSGHGVPAVSEWGLLLLVLALGALAVGLLLRRGRAQAY